MTWWDLEKIPLAPMEFKARAFVDQQTLETNKYLNTNELEEKRII